MPPIAVEFGMSEFERCSRKDRRYVGRRVVGKAVTRGCLLVRNTRRVRKIKNSVDLFWAQRVIAWKHENIIDKWPNPVIDKWLNAMQP